MSGELLRVTDLRVAYHTPAGPFVAVKGANFEVGPGEIVGVVGESGSGKSTLASTVMGLLGSNASISGGTVEYRGTDLAGLDPEEMRRLWGNEIAMIFQDPGTSLNPVLTIGRQLLTPLRQREEMRGQPDRVLRERVIRILDRVGLPDPERRLNSYPHEFSGGMRQRVMIAMALLSNPGLLIADEPVSALDVTLKKQINELLLGLREELGTAILYITHDLGVVAQVCDRVLVMNEGEIVETGDVVQIFEDPQHPYTRKLLAASPAARPLRREQPTTAREGDREPIVEARELRVYFRERTSPIGRLLRRQERVVKAVDGVDITIDEGEIVALVGESGSGKTTLGRTILRLQEETGGELRVAGQEITELPGGEVRKLRARMQMIFQDAVASLSPRRRVRYLLLEPFTIHDVKVDDPDAKVRELLEMVDLGGELANRYPHELSGGQARRVGIARALALNPRLLVADEPTAGLDVSVGSGIVDLLSSLRERLGLTLILITHDLNSIRDMADRVAVMNGGRIVERGTTAQILENPQHPYTRELINAVTIPDPRLMRERIRAATGRFEDNHPKEN